MSRVYRAYRPGSLGLGFRLFEAVFVVGCRVSALEFGVRTVEGLIPKTLSQRAADKGWQAGRFAGGVWVQGETRTNKIP